MIPLRGIQEHPHYCSSLTCLMILLGSFYICQLVGHVDYTYVECRECDKTGLTEQLFFVMCPNAGHCNENVPKTADTILCGFCDNLKAVT